MLTNPTIEVLKSLKLHGMLQALEEQQQNPTVQACRSRNALRSSSIASGSIATTSAAPGYCAGRA